MSGHSHYATIKRQKGLKDAQKGKIFSKMAKEIAIAAKEGGNIDPNFNYKLRMVLDKARSFNMPKINIERAINSGASVENLEEVTYEGFGPSGVAVMVTCTTDNRNRTSQEMKNLFERVGGSLGGPGSVSFNFENKGLMLVEKTSDTQTQMLKLIDLGVDDMEETDDVIEVYVAPEKLSEIRKQLEEGGFTVKSAELYMKPINFQTILDLKTASKVFSFLDELDEHDDVQKVSANVEIPENINE